MTTRSTFAALALMLALPLGAAVAQAQVTTPPALPGQALADSASRHVRAHPKPDKAPTATLARSSTASASTPTAKRVAPVLPQTARIGTAKATPAPAVTAAATAAHAMAAPKPPVRRARTKKPG